MAETAMPDIVEDRLLGGRLVLRQPARGHRAGTDAVLLAAALGDPGPLICDAGAGAGTVGLIAALNARDSRVRLIERDPVMAALATDNLALNGLAERGETIVCDLMVAKSRRAAGLGDGEASALYTNPPFHARGRVRVSPDKADAHVFEKPEDLQLWIKACLALLGPHGRFAMIHRADALPDAIDATKGRAGDLRVTPIHPREGAAASRIIVTATKGSRAPLRIAPGLILHRPDGRFTPLAEAIHRGEATFPDL